MITLNKNTKKAQTFLFNYENSKFSKLHEIYKDYSDKKIRVYYDIVHDMTTKRGKNLKLMSHNSQFFCAGYSFRKNKKNYLKYFTGYNVYLIEM